MSRYQETFLNPQGPGDARPTALQLIRDEGLENKLIDKVVLITGTSSGIGIETARAFHATGATVYGTVRNVSKGQEMFDEIMASDPANKAPMHLIEMSLDSLESVKRGAAEVLKKTDKLNVFVANAGVSRFRNWFSILSADGAMRLWRFQKEKQLMVSRPSLAPTTSAIFFSFNC